MAVGTNMILSSPSLSVRLYLSQSLPTPLSHFFSFAFRIHPSIHMNVIHVHIRRQLKKKKQPSKVCLLIHFALLYSSDYLCDTHRHTNPPTGIRPRLLLASGSRSVYVVVYLCVCPCVCVCSEPLIEWSRGRFVCWLHLSRNRPCVLITNLESILLSAEPWR